MVGMGTVITVLGAPRSGTSAITRALPVMGAVLGDELVKPGLDNPTGFWEDIPTQEINVRLLELAGRHIEWPVLSRENIELSPSYPETKRRAVELLQQRLEADPIWAFKDPRTSRLLFFWQDVFRRIGCADRYVLALRNPRSVAESLMVSSGIKYATGLVLWLECTVRAVQDTLCRSMVVVLYERLMENPTTEVLRIAEGLALEEHLLAPALNSYTHNFISPELMHIRHNQRDLADATREFPLIYDIYTLLSQQATDALTTEEFCGFWLPLYARFEREFPAFIAANPWMETHKAIFLPRPQRICRRLRAHGTSEMRRLTHRMVKKIWPQGEKNQKPSL